MMLSGDAIWMVAASALMTSILPGLALFYSGLVRRPSGSVSTLKSQMSFTLLALCVAWTSTGFSTAFGWAQSHAITSYEWLCEPWPGTKVPFIAFFIHKMMYAAVAPSVITAAFADRLLVPAFRLFIVLWIVMVLCPIIGWIWNTHGFLAKLGALDFAGGLVIFTSSGFTGLAIQCFALSRSPAINPRQIFEMHRRRRVQMAVGTGLLWIGHFGLNGGSASAGRAMYGLINSLMAASVAMFAWMLTEGAHRGKQPHPAGVFVGGVCGLAAAAGPAGYIRPWAAMLVGGVSAPICYGCVQLRTRLGWDDALDVWGLHGMGGLLGALLTGVLADPSVGGVRGGAALLAAQCAAGATVAAYSFAASYAILRAVALVTPLAQPRPATAEEAAAEEADAAVQRELEDILDRADEAGISFDFGGGEGRLIDRNAAVWDGGDGAGRAVRRRAEGIAQLREQVRRVTAAVEEQRRQLVTVTSRSAAAAPADKGTDSSTSQPSSQGDVESAASSNNSCPEEAHSLGKAGAVSGVVSVQTAPALQ